jgi:hypothetical protein
MGYTLDQLLDATGVSNLSGDHLTKKASAEDGVMLSKLAERCRRAVDATPDEYASASDRDLVEKTAAVAIIGRTLAEIREIDGASPEVTKTAAQSTPFAREQFIKTALEQGHGPKEIAEFLEKGAGLFGKAKRAIQGASAERGYARAGKAMAHGEKLDIKNVRHWQQQMTAVAKLPDSEKNKLLSRMRRTMGDEEMAKVLHGSHGSAFKNLEGAKSVMKAHPKGVDGGAVNAAGKPYKASMNIGGSTVGVTDAQIKKYKKPLTYGGAGLIGGKMLSGDKEKKNKGITISAG